MKVELGGAGVNKEALGLPLSFQKAVQSVEKSSADMKKAEKEIREMTWAEGPFLQPVCDWVRGAMWAELAAVPAAHVQS